MRRTQGQAQLQGALSAVVRSHVYAATSWEAAFLGTHTVSIGERALGSPMLMKSDRYWHVIPNPKSLQNPVSFFMTCRESAITGRREMGVDMEGASLTQPTLVGARTTGHSKPPPVLNRPGDIWHLWLGRF